ncbi:MAG: hypothetical protein HQ538_02445, partial [Parcubacteria group bacterium]|nr:hypothetical protein [Parcubacteria group bacterium]
MKIRILTKKFCDYSDFIRGYSKDTIRRYDRTINIFCKFSGLERIEEVTNKD